jgi:hypothetical protein
MNMNLDGCAVCFSETADNSPKNHALIRGFSAVMIHPGRVTFAGSNLRSTFPIANAWCSPAPPACMT